MLRWFSSLRCGGARELQTNFDELEGLLMQAESAQTAAPVEHVKQAVPPRVLLLACHVCCGPLWAASERALGTPALGRIWMRQNDSEMWP